MTSSVNPMSRPLLHPTCAPWLCLKTLLQFTTACVWLVLMTIPSVASTPPLIHPIKGKLLLEDGDLELNFSKKNNPTVVVFLSAKCPCSHSHMVELKALRSENPSFDFVAVHSNSDETLEESKSYFNSLNLNIPVIQDDTAAIANQFSALKTPHAYLLNSAGKIVYQGGVSNSNNFQTSTKHFLRDAISDLKSGQKVRTPRGRTLGCMIKRTHQ